MVDRDQLLNIAGAVRRFLEPAWLQWHQAWGEMPAVPSRWTDTRSSAFLKKVLQDDFGLDATWRSGTPHLFLTVPTTFLMASRRRRGGKRMPGWKLRALSSM